MDCRWKSTLILLLGVLRLAASAVEVGQCAGTSAKCVTHRDSALLQTSRGVQRRVRTKVVSGSTIMLRVQGKSGTRIAALEDGKVVATRDHVSDQDSFVVEKVRSPCGDVVSKGDTILLRAWTGNRVTVQEDGTVRALSGLTDVSEQEAPPSSHFVIDKVNDDGPILDGDSVYLKNSRTGEYIDADPALSPEGSVMTRSAEMREWQTLVVDVVEPWTATTPAPTRVPRTTSTTTSTPATGRQVVSAREWELFTLVNDLRWQGFRCGSTEYAPNNVTLEFSCRLWRAAYLHSEDMAEQNYLSHNSQDGRSPWDRAMEQGTVANAEMIAVGRAGAAGVLEQLKTQESSCNTLMKPALKALAVGHAEGGKYKHYWTQMLANNDTIDDTTCYPSTSIQAPAPTEIPETSGEPADEMVVDPWTQ